MKKLVVMAGLSGAGKSTIARQRYNGFNIVDCDELKKKIDGYDPNHPELVHEESKRLEKVELMKAMVSGEDFIYDTTGTNVPVITKVIKDAKEFGYKVELCYVKVSLETALRRNAQRERHVPEYIIRDKNDVLEESLELISLFVDSKVTIVNE